MDKNVVDKLILKLINNTLSDAESANLAHWLESPENLNYFNEYIALNHLIQSKKKFDHQDSLNEFKAKHINPELNKTKNNYWKYAVVAASIALLIYIPYIFKQDTVFNNPATIVESTIKAGTDKAILTLEDGSKITLEKGKQFIKNNLKSTGEDLVYSKAKETNIEIAYNYLTIPRGGQYHVTLSDGTEVWLNSESQIKYPTTFIDGKNRNVELVYGEAYFEVSPSTEHKGGTFNVMSKGQEIEVLGTKFNVKSYKDETKTFTTLVEGGIALSVKLQREILQPNQQAIVDQDSHTITIHTLEVYDEISWKDGLFSFKNKSLKDILKVLSRWYDVEVVFENTKLKNKTFNGILDKGQSISEILTIISNTNNIAYEINNKTIIFR